MKIPLTNYEVFKSSKVKELHKKAEAYEDTARLRPAAEMFNLAEQDNALVPTYASDINRTDMQDLAKLSAVYRQITITLQSELFRRGGEFKEKFVVKCTNDECLKEFDHKAEVCDACGGTVREPDMEGRNEIETFFKKVNDNGDHIIDVCKQCEFDLDTVDDAFMAVAKEYEFNAQGEMIEDNLKKSLELIQILFS